jgi:hypothetical protein
MPVKFSNPRLHAPIQDYPLGGNKRGLCVFNIESHPKRGYRCTRQTTGKPKAHTYGGKAAIVDGDDGRTYLIQFAGSFNFIKVSRSDFMDASGEVTGTGTGGVFPESHPERYAELKALIEQANA